MKSFFLLKSATVMAAALLISTAGLAQKKIESPRDSVSGMVGAAKITVNYGSPSVKGRKIWGDLVPYGKVWRAGANEATTFTTDKTITVEGKALAAGQYGFFVIPNEGSWTIIFNKTAKQWGAYDYKEKDDVLRVEVKGKKSTAMNERLVYKVNPTGISLIWDNLEVPVLIK